MAEDPPEDEPTTWVFKDVADVDLFSPLDTGEWVHCHTRPAVTLTLESDGTARFKVEWTEFVHTHAPEIGCIDVSYAHETIGTWDGAGFEVTVLSPRRGRPAELKGSLDGDWAVVEDAAGVAGRGAAAG